MPRLALLAHFLAAGAFAASGPHDSAIGPDYKAAPEMTPRADVPKGTIKEFTMLSTDSKAYPGIAKNKPGEVVPYKRKVQVYLPAQLPAGQPARLLLVTDGPWYTKRVATALDNLIADKRVPVQVAVLVESGGGDSKGSQRGLEYDTLSAKYAEFIEAEVLPRVTKETGVVFSKNPAERAAMGAVPAPPRPSRWPGIGPTSIVACSATPARSSTSSIRRTRRPCTAPGNTTRT